MAVLFLTARVRNVAAVGKQGCGIAYSGKASCEQNCEQRRFQSTSDRLTHFMPRFNSDLFSFRLF